MFDLSDILLDLATETITVTRTAVGTTANGVYTLGATSTILNVSACVWPATGQEMLLLEEGFRTRDVRALVVSIQLQCTDPDQGTVADLLTLAEGTFQVQKIEPWQRAGNFWKALAVRVQN